MLAQFYEYDTLECMTTTMHNSDQHDTILVPVMTFQEMPQVTAAHRNQLMAEFDQIEAEMKAGAFEVYSREWLRSRFLKAFGCTAA